ncbi:hypothetical protein K3495_g4619 [Podosphaera aphanis]|nr:hypothetical protein K3495_g4619 [Podosphaera aphanis]
MTRGPFAYPRLHRSKQTIQTLQTHSRLHHLHTRAKKYPPKISSSGSCLSKFRLSQLVCASTRRLSIQDRELQTQPQIAILGGGISGLATAHYLTKENPDVRVTIYEGSHRLGGWLNSECVDLGNGSIILESGPRSLRFGNPESLATAELIQDLDLKNEIIVSSKDSVAARNRYVYYPDHLVRMPGPGENILVQIKSFLCEPIFKGALSAAFFEISSPPRPTDLEDESVGSFFSRRLGGEHLVNNIHSAVAHGIYAGDIYQLSIRSLFPSLWYLEKEFGSLIKGAAICSKKKIHLATPSELALRAEILPCINSELVDVLKSAGVYTFRGGIETLSKALEKKLRTLPNVEINLNDKAKSLESTNDGILLKSSKNKSPKLHTHVISTLLPHITAALTPHLPSLALVPTVTVMVVNLYYHSTKILSVRGFGYLIPRSIPFEQNPECALGVVFDSDAIQGLDTVAGTKLTVMLGGHWWDGTRAYPDEEEGRKMAQAVLKRHLGITELPQYVKVHLQKECIPQYTLGHTSRLAKAKKDLGAFRGRLSVAGNGYQGVGVNDSIAAARRLVSGLEFGNTGLEWLEEAYTQVVE